MNYKIFLAGHEISLGAFRTLLEHAVVNFEFIKLNGSVREAAGSRNLDLLARQGVRVEYPKGTGRHNPDCYWDLSRRDFRSFSEFVNHTINIISWSRNKEDVFIPRNSQLPKTSQPKPVSDIKIV